MMLVGTVVRLKSGGPLMTVMGNDPSSFNKVICSWFQIERLVAVIPSPSGDHHWQSWTGPHSSNFYEDVLEIVDPVALRTGGTGQDRNVESPRSTSPRVIQGLRSQITGDTEETREIITTARISTGVGGEGG